MKFDEENSELHECLLLSVFLSIKNFKWMSERFWWNSLCSGRSLIFCLKIIQLSPKNGREGFFSVFNWSNRFVAINLSPIFSYWLMGCENQMIWGFWAIMELKFFYLKHYWGVIGRVLLGKFIKRVQSHWDPIASSVIEVCQIVCDCAKLSRSKIS